MSPKVKQEKFAQRGTATWKLNRFREYLLSEFLKDLEFLEADGLTDQECDHVKECLRGIISACRSHALNGVLESAFTKQLEKFLDVYIQWNGPRGNDPAKARQRREQRQRLKTVRRDLSGKVRECQKDLSGVISDRLCDSFWNNLEAVPKTYPGEFRYLERGFRRVRSAQARVEQ